MSAPKILIVDDEPDIVWSLRYALFDAGYEVITASSGADAIAAVYQSLPDLVILDMMMPDLSGSQVCRVLRRDQRMAAVPIMLLSRQTSVEDRIKGLNEGADDFLAKPFDFGELKARINALFRRTGRSCPPAPAPASQLAYRDLSLDLRSHKVMVDGRSVLLTPAEFDLLRYLLAHQGEVFSSEQLLQQVWQDPHPTKDHGLVRWHVMNLRAKIEPDPATPIYLRTVPRHGYMVGGAA